MKIYIVRHAEAVEKGSVSDEARYLTGEGRKAFRKTAAGLRKRDIEPDIILTSPLVRAVQTAEILAERLDFDGELAAVPGLAGMVTRADLAKMIEPWPQAKRVVVVGHEPFLGALVGELLGAEKPFSLEKGSCIALKCKMGEEPARFAWYQAGKTQIDRLEELYSK